MNHSPSHILAEYLIGEGILIDPDDSGSGNWRVYIGSTPDGIHADHEVAVAVDTAPVKDGRVQGTPLFHHGVQFILRSTDYSVGYAKATEIAEDLATVSHEDVTVDDDTYTIINVTQTTGVVVMGQEPGTKRRELFSVNFLATLREV